MLGKLGHVLRMEDSSKRELIGYKRKEEKLDGPWYAAIGCKLKQDANEGCNSCATVVQVLQDFFYVLLHVLFYL